MFFAIFSTIVVIGSIISLTYGHFKGKKLYFYAGAVGAVLSGYFLITIFIPTKLLLGIVLAALGYDIYKRHQIA